MVSATRVPNTAAVSEYRWAPRIASRFGSIDRTICWFSSKLRLQREATCRFPLIWLGRRLVHLGRDGMGGIVVLSADHQLPGDAGHLVGQRHGGELGRFALEQLGKPRRGMALCSLPGAGFAAPHLLDHGGCANHQHAAQGLVAGAGDRSEPGFAGCRVILWGQPDPRREISAGSEGFLLADFHDLLLVPDRPAAGDLSPSPAMLI